MPRVSSYRLLDVQASRMGAVTGLIGVLVRAGWRQAASPGWAPWGCQGPKGFVSCPLWL